ncbi:dicarboxylate/amino acid:cation symporter [Saccharopolyspora sp. K220]|uniref:dicarboxylate/amino acid:cation symporter n=1 Tax=Saccharopolyspora soli TaxID=2926618 RepID=UPI001F5989E4|nr:dicarboxylate/amino acid:cation symporter [Saccharopolyspora soli]MCI2416755.1 dicarboxylate/amino acid:cation symporter [Saccharopolyspora soli]
MEDPNATAAPPGSGDGPERRRRLSMPPLGVQVLVALVVGAVLGFAAPSFSEHLKIVGDGFIRLIEMSIVPLIFPLIVVSIARLESVRAVGRLAVKALLYFEIVTTVILIVTLFVAFATGIGRGANLHSLAPANTDNIQRSMDLPSLFLNIIPENVFAALGEGDLLAILFFAVFLGLALTKIGDKAKPVITVLDGIADAMFQVIAWVVRLTPLAVVSFVAYNTAHYGWDLVLKLVMFVAVFYGAAIVVLVVLFPIIAAIFRVPYVPMLRAVADLLLLSFLTRSAEVVLAPLIRRLDGFGVDRTVSSFSLPLGYSFNADGATMYEALAVVFLAHAYGVELTIPQLLTMLLVLMLLTKGIAGVPSAAIVVLFSASAVIGLPAEGVAILLAVDFVVDMARTGLNVAGNSLATLVIAKSEGLFRRPKEEVTA